MAIFRGGVKIFGSDVRIGLNRDRSLDNILLDPRFRQIEGGLVPDNPNLSATKPALINQMLQYIMQAEGLGRSGRFYTSFRLPTGSRGPEMGSEAEFENFENADGLPVETRGFATSDLTQQIQNQDGKRVNAFCKAITMPDRTMTTSPIVTGPGAPRHFVTDHTYGDLSATFYADKYLRERQYFELWQQAAFNTLTNNYELYENYVSDIKDNQYIKYTCDHKGFCCNINHMYILDNNIEIQEPKVDSIIDLKKNKKDNLTVKFD